MTTAVDVAAALLERCGPMDTWKLQKLVYYSQAWHLAWRGHALFEEPIEAWANGPVVPTLWAQHRQTYRVASLPAGYPSAVAPDSDPILDFVCGYYGKLTGDQLSKRTHEEDPWRITRAADHVRDGERSNATISPALMADFYRSQPESEQAWFWTPEWQAGERRARDEIKAGDVTHFDDASDFLASL
jgi:uncharacterized phage-associated protein